MFFHHGSVSQCSSNFLLTAWLEVRWLCRTVHDSLHSSGLLWPSSCSCKALRRVWACYISLKISKGLVHATLKQKLHSNLQSVPVAWKKNLPEFTLLLSKQCLVETWDKATFIRAERWLDEGNDWWEDQTQICSGSNWIQGDLTFCTNELLVSATNLLTWK